MDAVRNKGKRKKVKRYRSTRPAPVPLLAITAAIGFARRRRRSPPARLHPQLPVKLFRISQQRHCLPSVRHARLRLGRRWHTVPHAWRSPPPPRPWRSPPPPRPWRSPPPRPPLAHRVLALLLPDVSFARTAARWDPRSIRSGRCFSVQRRAQAPTGIL
jgi:hypothetical protein